MALFWGDRIRETTTTEGLLAYVLGGADGPAFQAFADKGVTGGLAYYMATNFVDWEVGLGTLTVGPPHSLARTLVIDSSNGGAAVDWGPGTKTIGNVNPVYNITSVAIENGFEDQSDSVLSFTDGTRTLEIAPAVDEFSFWSGGIRHIKTSADSVAISDVEGLWHIYYDETGALQATQVETEDYGENYASVSAVYWDATNSTGILVGDKRYGRSMDSATRKYLSKTAGVQYAYGLAVVDTVADGNGSSDTHAQCGLEAGSIYDEDMEHTLDADTAPASVPILYRSGASGYWRQIAATDFLVTTSGGSPVYNQWTGATWQLTNVSSAKLFLMHLFATDDLANGWRLIVGQQQYDTVLDARMAAGTEIFDMDLAGLPFDEFKAVATFIFQYSASYSNAVKARLVSTDSGGDFIDWRYSDIAALVASGSTSTTWGSIGGTLADQTDLAAEFSLYPKKALPETITNIWTYSAGAKFSAAINLDGWFNIGDEPSTELMSMGFSAGAFSLGVYTDHDLDFEAYGDNTSINMRVWDASVFHLYDRLILSDTDSKIYGGADLLGLTVDVQGYVVADKRLGIGVSSPATDFHVKSITPAAGAYVENSNTSSDEMFPVLELSHSKSSAVGTGVGIRFSANNQSAIGKSFAYIGAVVEDNSILSEDGAIVFYNITGGSTTEKMRLTSEGHLVIGASSPVGVGQLDIVNASGNAVITLERTDGTPADAFINAAPNGAQFGSVGNYPVRILQNSQLAAAWDTSKNLTLEGNLYVKDNEYLNLGAGNDIRLKHDSGASTNYIGFYNHDAQITQNTNGKSLNLLVNDGTTNRSRFFANASNSYIYAGAGLNRLIANATEPSYLYGDWDLSGGSLSIPDSENLNIGTGNDIQIYHNPAGPSDIFDFYNADTYFRSQTDTKSILFRTHDGTSTNQNRLTIGPNNVYLYAGTGGSSAEKLRTDPSLSYLSGDWGTAASGSLHVGNSTTAAIGSFTVDQSAPYGRFSVGPYTSISDDGSVALEAMVDLTSSAGGFVSVHTHSGLSVLFYIRAAANSVGIVSNPFSVGAVTDTDTKICLISDGDGTFTLKMRVGSTVGTMVFFWGA